MDIEGYIQGKYAAERQIAKTGRISLKARPFSVALRQFVSGWNMVARAHIKQRVGGAGSTLTAMLADVRKARLAGDFGHAHGVLRMIRAGRPCGLAVNLPQ